MSWKSTWIYLTAAAVLFALIWFVERPIRNEQQPSRVVLPGLDPGAINTVEVTPRGAGEIRAERTEGATGLWRLAQPISYPAQSGPILTLLNALAELNWQDRITADELKSQPDAQEKFGFTEAQAEIVLRGANVADKILIGQTSPYGDQVFLEIVGNPDIYRVSSDLVTNIPAIADAWRDRALLNLAGVPYEAIEARSPGRGFDFEVERDPASHLWFMTKPVKARADNAKINELVGRLRELRVRQFITDDPRADLELYGLQASPQTPDLDLSFWHGSNVTAELQMGLSPSNQPDLAFARRLDPSNVVVIARDLLRPWQGAYTNFLDYHFISVSPAAIETIRVRGEGQFTVQKQPDGPWLVRDGATTFPADTGMMRNWLASFTNIQTQIEATVATDFAKYGLSNPLLQYTLESGDAASNVMARIEFGGNQNESGKVFERRPDELSLNFISRDDFDLLPRAAWQLRDRRIWSFNSSNVVSLTIHQEGATRKYVRDPDGGWTFAPGYHGPPMVNWPAVEEGVHRLGNLRAVFWSGVGDAHLRDFGFPQADFSLSLEVKQGDKTETRDIEFGGRSRYSYPYAAVVKDGHRLIFEFPVDLYENFVDPHMSIPIALRYHH